MGLKKSFKKFVKNPVKYTVKKAETTYDRVESEVSRSWDDIEEEGSRTIDNLETGIKAAAVGFLAGGPILGVAALTAGVLFGSETEELIDVLTGEYHREQKKLAAKQVEYEQAVAEYERVMQEFRNEFVIPEEIFQLSHGNKAQRAAAELGGEIDVLRAQLEKAIAEFNQTYKFVQRTLKDSVFKYFMWIPLVIGGLANDATDVILKGDVDALKRIVSVILLVIIIVVSALAGAFTGGATWAVTVMAISALISLVIMLDGSYAQGMVMNGVWSMLDMLLNDVLQADEIDGLGTKKLKDPDYYDKLTAGFAAINALVGAIASMGAMAEGAFAQGGAMNVAAGELGTMVGLSPAMSSAAGTLSSIYGLYSSAMVVGDLIEQNKQYEALVKEVEAKKSEIETNIFSWMRNKMMESYREAEDMLEYTSNIVADNAMSFFNKPGTSFDPEMVIAANFGYRYQGTSIMDFGIDMTFNDSDLAGSNDYIASIIHRI